MCGVFCNILVIVYIFFSEHENVEAYNLMSKDEKEKSYMGILATPNKNSYVVKKNCVAQIVNSKTPQKKRDSIQSNAALFRKNNLKSGK